MLKKIPTLRRQRTALQITRVTSVFNPDTGRYVNTPSTINASGVLTHVASDVINHTTGGSYSSEDRELHIDIKLNVNEEVLDVVGDKKYKVSKKKEGELYYGQYNAYIIERAGNVD